MGRWKTVMAVMAIAAVCAADAVAGACTEWNYSVTDPPISKTGNVGGILEGTCLRITAPANSIMMLDVGDRIAVVKFAGNKMNISEKAAFRTGKEARSFEISRVEESGSIYLKMQISDVPRHLKGGADALWHEIAERSAIGEKIYLIVGYPTQALIPRGYSARILPDVAVKVKFAGQEKQHEADELISLEGKPGVDILELTAIDRDGSATIGAMPRRNSK